jgi:DNA repair exonuclease SbcCD ATPase subunit
MADRIDGISHAIGSLESSVKTLTDTWQRQDREAAEGRRRLYDKVEELKAQQEELARQQQDLTGKLAKQTEELAEIKPAIKRFEAQRQRAEGARSLIKLMWMGIVAFATGLGYVGHELLVYFWPPKH